MRGGKDYVNMWTAGDNVRDEVYAADISVTDSYYYEPCDERLGERKPKPSQLWLGSLCWPLGLAGAHSSGLDV